MGTDIHLMIETRNSSGAWVRRKDLEADLGVKFQDARLLIGFDS